MATILLLETATEVCSVALAIDGKVAGFRENREGFSHAELVTVYAGQLLSDVGLEMTNLDAVCCSRGPGSYTGLRIGTSVAKGICYAMNIPLLAVGTLHAMAFQSAMEEEKRALTPGLRFCPMLDARRMEVYTALFDGKGNPLGEISAMVINQDSFAAELNEGPLRFLGNGAHKCKSVLSHPNALFVDDFHASARFMSFLAEERFNKKHVEDVSYFEPFYLKDFMATVPKNKIF
jgi:tRNA threonylcarbamoyladenosine biosynthesis protein TsaB